MIMIKQITTIIAFFFCFLPSVSLASEITTAIQQCNRSAYFSVPELKPAQEKTLKEGKVVTIIERKTDKAGRAIGMILINTDIKTLWAAYRDALHFQLQESTTEYLLSVIKPDTQIWYGYLDLPWPLADRHWIIKTWNNYKLATKTNNACWEHPWQLMKEEENNVEAKLAGKKIPSNVKPAEAIYTPVNEGAFLLVTIAPKKTLLVYHASTVVGGNVPSNLLPNFIASTFKGMLMDMRNRAEKLILGHYKAPHKAINGGDRKPIDLFE